MSVIATAAIESVIAIAPLQSVVGGVALDRIVAAAADGFFNNRSCSNRQISDKTANIGGVNT